MKLSSKLFIFLATLAALAPPLASASCSDGLHNDDELGLDCGGSEPGCPVCSCATDLERDADPPTLINSNLDLVGDERETGLAGDNLRVALRLDRKVFLADESVTEGGATLDYSAPEVEFVDLAGGTNAALCSFGAGDYTVELPAGDEADFYPDACGARAGEGGAVLWLDSDFRSTLRDCGFRLAADEVTDAAGRTFAQYEGQVRVRTEERGDETRGVITKRVIEAGFTIVVQLPLEVNVSSGVVDAYGTAIELATLTHQVWNLAERRADINLFTSVQYPYELVVDGFSLVFDGEGENPPLSLEGYPVGLPDADGSATSSLLDYFAAPSAGLPANGTTDFGTPQVLPPTQCRTSSTGSVGADACNQNVHLRLTPSPQWCDLGFDLELRLAVQCREGVEDVACDTDALPAEGRTATVRFSIASDNFCPRVVEIAELEGEMALYEDDEWGAHPDEGVPDGATYAPAVTQYPGWFPDESRAADGSNLGARWTQAAFAFGTELHVETRVVAEAGSTLASSTVRRVWISSDDTTDLDAADGAWQRLVYEHDPAAAAAAAGTGAALPSSVVCTDFAGVEAPIACPVAVSNNVALNSMSGDAVPQLPAVNPADPATFAGRLGEGWEGVSRLTIGVGTHTVLVPAGQDAPEGVKVWAELVVAYRTGGVATEDKIGGGSDGGIRSVLHRIVARAPRKRPSRAVRALAGPEPAHPPTPPALGQQTLPVSFSASAAPSATTGGGDDIVTGDGGDNDGIVTSSDAGSSMPIVAAAAGFALLALVVLGAAMWQVRRSRAAAAAAAAAGKNKTETKAETKAADAQQAAEPAMATPEIESV